MESPPLSSASTVPVPPPHLSYADSLDSSPRSRNTDSWDEPPYPGGAPLYSKLRLMCSYGGHIVPRPHDKSLCYVGGDTRIVVIDRRTSLSDFSLRLSKTLMDGRSFSLKYQLPNEDLDSLISVTTDEDLENMIDEYDRLSSTATTTTHKSSRLRLFLFPTKPEPGSSIGSLLENSIKSEDWFLNALNGDTRGFSNSSSVNCLLGLDDDIVANNNTNSADKDVEAHIESFGNVKGVSGGSNKQAQDIHSVPDSPMLETTSSFGSTSSSPSMANLPPIRVHVEDQKVGIEEQFSQMNLASGANNVQQHKQDDGDFMVLSSPPTVLTSVAAATVVSGVQMGAGVVVGEYPNRILTDDERSEQGLPVGYRKPPQAQLQATQSQHVPTQLQQKPTGGVDLASPDSVSSDGSVANPLSRQKPSVIYQDPTVHIPSGNNWVSANPIDVKNTDPNTRVQMQQVTDSGYILPSQFDQQQQLQFHQQPQFVHANTQYVHHQPTGGMPIGSYYSMYPPQQHHHPQQQVYYMHSRPTQHYNLPMQQPSYSDGGVSPSSRPQTPPPASMVPTPTTFNPATSKPEMATGMYRTATPQFFQHQPQYVQIHHPSQSIVPSSAANVNYAYEYADPSHAQMYYRQQMAPQLAAQYQTMTSPPAMVLPEASAQLPMENVRQQVRTSQP